MPIYAQSSTLRTLLIPLVDVDQTTIAADQVLQYNATTGKFENKLFTSGAEAVLVTASNVGGGEEVFKEKTNSDISFRTLTASTGVTVTTVGDNIQIAADGASATGLNIGVGAPVFKQKNGDNLEFRKLDVGGASKNFSIQLNGDTIEFTSSAEINTASNLGSGFGIFNSKVDQDIQLKSIVAGTNVTITEEPTEITISAGTSQETASSFQFTASFGGDGSLTGVSDLPSGWSSTVNGNKVTVTHTVTKMVKNISYWGRDAVNGWQLRFPNAGYQATIPVGNESTTFIVDINASVAGADANSTAKVNVIF
jgi:hypothetical protein